VNLKKKMAVGVFLSAIGLMFSGVARADKKTPPAQQTPVASVAANDDTYVIGPEDVLNVNVWKEAEVSGSVPVRPDGKISLPLLNDIQAAGSTPMQLTNQITEKLKRFLTDPHVTATVTAVNSRRVYIIGEVARPGAFPLQPNMTVLQALTSAGGPSPYAKTTKIYMLRTENGVQTKVAFNYKEVVKGRSTEQNVTLKPGDTIVVP
jgi:polysaccharide biosynthesis/export protein